ncbi:universal stress protein [Pedobacter duraquae]|uniref:Nucleotide-binding universal stress UspA family protein n=1 Tax=Pedobacter duraquae TaxID=425511 RepID=A0A4R6IP58_9SPHI|nr:universal stress protein [Pedobacter duraquae]TDO23921.1 nucleotide-binding universal stress UspA family protein [Pedobacter duraquae]
MKTLLFLTDFSENATHAADYAYKLAKQLRLKMLICHAVNAAAEIPQTGFVTWPPEIDETLLKESVEELKILKKRLEHTDRTDGFHPIVNCTNGLGSLIDVVDQVATRHQIALVVMGTHGNSGMSALLLGNHSRFMINGTKLPLLLVPPDAIPVRIKKIGFASDFRDLEKDLKNIYNLVPFARMLDAEILLVHIFKEGESKNCIWDQSFLKQIADKANYPNIFYRNVIQNDTLKGLSWISEFGQVDMLAMVHKSSGFMANLVGSSHTHKMAGQTIIPLFVFPGRD